MRLRRAETFLQVLRPALREMNFGDWEGMSWEQIEQLDPEYAQEVDGCLSPLARALRRELPGI